jgi:hypothetical protein
MSEEVYLTNSDELVLAYFIKIFYILFNVGNTDLIDKIIKESRIELDEKYSTLISFLKNFSDKLSSSGSLKEALVDIKNFILLGSKDSFFLFFSSLLMLIINCKIKKVDEYEKYRKVINKLKDKYILFEKLIKVMEEVVECKY